MDISKTKSSFYRRLLIAGLIESRINTIPKLMAEIKIPRRTAQDTIIALEELDIECIYEGATKNGHYEIRSWGAIDKNWVINNLERIKETLNY
ncbi:winged helix-turn-helix domain-containing protein [Pseudoalteromonas sp. 2CM39R]|uniref:helix-turn-helix domain-containing protein n=1 Tax=Pseudoalteromonas sp. 2CM39R TaxID=2929856 RepID=UPI0020BD93B6|nr:helix-turn-helix domain-containing protein [Pseudoalteromonas sp. 2CM39R]MCK8124660.1 winged helix-turn-helix domain-containing protein [Pseudoalteromonas sp. 2CM39R]